MSRNSLKSVCKLIQATQKEIPIEAQFVNDLKRSIELTDKKEARQPSKTYKPSSMNCIRNMFYQRIGAAAENESNAVGIGICESGTDRHERVQNAVTGMKENNIDCVYINVADFIKQRNIEDIDVIGQQGFETKLFHKKLNMSFLCDGIIKYKNKYYILEIKTESIYKWVDRKSVADGHKNQATAYSIAFGINEVLFLYINRDNCDMKAFMYSPSDEQKKILISKIESCEEFVKNKVLPDKPEDMTVKNCQYCAYRKLCNADMIGDVS